MRALAASAAAAAAFFALGLPGIPPVQPAATEPAAGTGQVGRPGLAPAILTDSRALVPFGRTIVGTVAKGGSAPLNVASAGLKRPPEGSLLAPLELLVSSSPFGFRISPITGTGGDFHLGQDFAAGCGTRVYSADAGVVRAAGWHPWGGGNRVEIDHGNGLITTYNHLEAIAVRTGENVQAGQVIARVGTTGWSTGCHLHFETILHGVHTSPLRWTLLAIRQLDELQDIAMVSYADKVAEGAKGQRWAIPVAEENSHTVLGGEKELAEAPEAEAALPTTAPPDTAPTGGPASGPTPTGTAKVTTAETATGTATASEKAMATESATETETATATESATSTPRPTPTTTDTSPTMTTASPSPTPTFPGWPSWQGWWTSTEATAEATPAPVESSEPTTEPTDASPETAATPSETTEPQPDPTDAQPEATATPTSFARTTRGR